MGTGAALGKKAISRSQLIFEGLRAALANELRNRPELHKHKRAQMRVSIKLRGTDISGRAFQEETSSENVSAEDFLAICTASLVKDAAVDVYMI